MKDEIRRYIESVARQPSSKARNDTLKVVPAHLRERVKTEVIAKFAAEVKRGVKR